MKLTELPDFDRKAIEEAIHNTNSHERIDFITVANPDGLKKYKVTCDNGVFNFNSVEE